VPDNEAGVHIAPRLAGEGGGTDKESVAYRSENWINRTGRLMGTPVNRNRPVNRCVYYGSENILVKCASIL